MRISDWSSDVCSSDLFLNGFPTRSGKFEFAADWQAVGPLGHRIPALPDHVDIIDRATGERPYRMVTAPARNYLNTSFTETPTSRRREARPTVMVHPDTAAALGFGAGDRGGPGHGQGPGG